MTNDGGMTKREVSASDRVLRSSFGPRHSSFVLRHWLPGHARNCFGPRSICGMAQAQTLKIGSRKVAISNPDKVFYNAGKFTKLDVINYYLRVAPFLLPHFRGRPVTLKRYPNGIHGEVFYEKDSPSFKPDWVRTFPVPRREGGPDINYIVVNDAATLAWTANIAALELHPFLHRKPDIMAPTFVVFDLDPGTGA